MAIEKIKECIEENKSFKLEAGAGSGKTFTLIQTLKHITRNNKLDKNKKIVCITYTNIAKNEIIQRVEYDKKIDVYTVHEFLWKIIKAFQNEIKQHLIELLKEKNKDIEIISEVESLNTRIEYKQYTDYSKGIISHDDILKISVKLFAKNKKIVKILISEYSYIFIDEYQDTNFEVMKIFMEEINGKTNIVLGLFGDSFQKIYPGNKLELSPYNLENIYKKENFRCSKEVIKLLNNLRTDIEQYPAGENLKIEGKVLFYNYEIAEKFKIDEFQNDILITELGTLIGTTKKLYLTHKKMAEEKEFLELSNLYKFQENLRNNSKNRECKLTNFLYDIEEIFELYKNREISFFLKKITYKVYNNDTKRKLKEWIEMFAEKKSEMKIGEVISQVEEFGLLKKEKEYNEEKNRDFYSSVMQIDYKQFEKARENYKSESEFETYHGTKGAEYDNVIIIIDDASWNQYSFEKYFSKTFEKEESKIRNQNLFYVASSRAKVNLIVVMLSKLSLNSINNIKKIFGEKNFKSISN